MSASAAGGTPALPDLPARLSFLDTRAKARAVIAVKAFESHTSAELVVTAKKRAQPHPEVPLLFGIAFASITLLILLFYPLDFSVTYMPIDTLMGFGAGFGLAWFLPPLQRMAIGKTKMRAGVVQAAKVAFVDLGVTKTTGRTGVLVYVALFEQMVEIITDAGITAEAKKAAEDARVTLEAALVRLDIRAFAETLEALGPTFATTMARSADDVNELADDLG